VGLRTDSVIALDNLATVPENRLPRPIGRCPDMSSVDEVLTELLGLDGATRWLPLDLARRVSRTPGSAQREARAPLRWS
jgi:hypothetical protein